METKICPYCGEEIKAAAFKCKHCGEWIPQEEEEVAPKVQKQGRESIYWLKPMTLPCPYCGETINTDSKACPHCGEALSDWYDEAKGERNWVQRKSGVASLFQFGGRIGRLEYFLTQLISLLIVFLTAALIAASEEEEFLIIPVIFMGSLGICALVVLLAASAKRFHDHGMGGGWVIAQCIPIVGLITGIMLLFGRGDIGTNRFGPDPRDQVNTGK